MAEEVGNFPLDQGNTSAIRGLEQAREEAGRPRRLEDAEEEVREPGRTQESEAEEERDVTRPERTEDRVELTQEAREQNEVLEQNRAATQEQESRRDQLAEREVAEEEARARSVIEQGAETQDEFQRTRTEPNPTNGDTALTPDQGGSDPEESLREGFQLGNVQRDTGRLQEFSTRNQEYTVEEISEEANDLRTDPVSQARAQREENTEVAENITNAPQQQNEQLQRRVEEDNAEIRGTEEVEIQENNLAETGSNVSETRAEDRAEDARQAARNEPPLDIPSSDVEPIEELQDPLEEAQDTNPLRAPGPSEIRDEPDATAIETERGQNVSNLI